ncbi:hypothetical protein GCM10022226_08140 [Sphaerisporangium flaviroseum]|uniref:Uncharacterized protein n=1 Tax=Sphaerisporangium flaviroseum TaxID=509199 RepID=A0ABP7HIQ5_9ACTN
MPDDREPSSTDDPTPAATGDHVAPHAGDDVAPRARDDVAPHARDGDTSRRTPLMVLTWAWVGIPFAYGVYELFQRLTQLFGG